MQKKKRKKDEKKFSKNKNEYKKKKILKSHKERDPLVHLWDEKRGLKKRKKNWKTVESSYETDSVSLIVLVLRTNLPGAMPLHATVNFRKSDRDYRGAADNELLSRALLSLFFSLFSSLSASRRQLNRPVNNYSFASHLLSTW